MARKPQVRIISHPLCPFAQRAILLLLVKGLGRGQDFEVAYVDLAHLPPWFADTTVGGRMPVLQLDGHTASVHAGPMTEYLDALFDPPMRRSGGEEVRECLRQREGVAHVDAALAELKAVFTAATPEELDSATTRMFAELSQLEARISSATVSDAPSDPMGMFEIAAGPLFSLALHFPWLRDHRGWTAVPRVRALGDRLEADLRVRASRCPDYGAAFIDFFSLFHSEFRRRVA